MSARVRSPSQPWAAATGLTVSAVALGWSIQIGNGTGNPLSFQLLGLALVAAAAAVLGPANVWSRGARWVFWAVMAGGLLFQFYLLRTSLPAIYLRRDTNFVPFVWGITAAALLCAAAFVPGASVARHRATALLALHFLLGIWLLVSSPRPFIDVFTFHVEALNAFLAGQNPYAITMTDIYGHGRFYAPGLLENGRVLQGFPYPPLSLFLALPGYLLGDYRAAELVALSLTAGLMMQAAPDRRVGYLAAGAYLFTPREFFVLEQGWTEPFTHLMLALVLFCALRARRLLPYALGLLISVKQYNLLMLPFALLLLPRPLGWKSVGTFFGKTAATALVVSAPLILWNVPAYYHSTIEVQLHAPFRPESLSFLAWYAGAYGRQLPSWIAFAVLVPLGALCYARAPRTPAGFAGALALVYMAFFALSKQAFTNYYFSVIGMLLCAVACLPMQPVPIRAQREGETG